MHKMKRQRVGEYNLYGCQINVEILSAQIGTSLLMNSPKIFHITQKRNCLQRLPQTHLICQDTINSILIQWDHPIQTSHLVISHLSILDVWWGRVEAEYRLLFSVSFSEEFLIFFLFCFAMAVTGKEIENLSVTVTFWWHCLRCICSRSV